MHRVADSRFESMHKSRIASVPRFAGNARQVVLNFRPATECLPCAAAPPLMADRILDDDLSQFLAACKLHVSMRLQRALARIQVVLRERLIFDTDDLVA